MSPVRQIDTFLYIQNEAVMAVPQRYITFILPYGEAVAITSDPAKMTACNKSIFRYELEIVCKSVNPNLLSRVGPQNTFNWRPDVFAISSFFYVQTNLLTPGAPLIKTKMKIKAQREKYKLDAIQQSQNERNGK